MNNETYVSLYNYKGQPTRMSGIGKKVYAAAKAKGINIVYEQLPAEKQTAEYPSVATYPMSFLDEYFEVKPKTELELLTERVTMLESLVAHLLKQKESPAEIVEDDDDLPF